jgi:addiction module HigA family antidote
MQESAITPDEFAPVTPREMLREEFLKEYGLSQSRLALAIGISPNRIADIVRNRRRITADTALRLSVYFGNSPEFWLNMQTHYDLKIARRQTEPRSGRAHPGASGRVKLSSFRRPRAPLRAGCRAGRGRGRRRDG